MASKSRLEDFRRVFTWHPLFLDLALIGQQCLCHHANNRQFNELCFTPEREPGFSPADSPVLGKVRRALWDRFRQQAGSYRRSRM
jgi:hypothetical protein